MDRQVTKEEADVLTRFIDYARRAVISLADMLYEIDSLTDKGITAWNRRESRHLIIKFRLFEKIHKN